MSISTLTPEVLEEATDVVAYGGSLDAQSGDCEGAASFAVSGESVVLTPTEQALRCFISHVEQVTGVIKVCRYRVGVSNEEGVMVVVADLFSSITHDVIRVQEMVYNTFPGIRFSMDIKDASTVVSAETAGGFYPHPASGHLLPAREKAKLFNGRLNRRQCSH